MQLARELDLYRHLEKIEAWSFGNGRPGADERLRAVEEEVQPVVALIKEMVSEREAIRNRLRGAIVLLGAITAIQGISHADKIAYQIGMVIGKALEAIARLVRNGS